MKAAKILALLLLIIIASGRAQAASQPKVITLGYWESPNGELLVKETGALSKAFPDIKIRWLEFQSGTDILTAMQSGSLDFATIGTPPAVMGIVNNYPFRVFYLHDVIGESEGLIVRKSSGINSISDLKGKKIAVPFGTTSHFAFLNVLKANGLKVSDFTLYDMTPPDIYAAWHRGDIDGAYTRESVKSQLIEADVKELISSARNNPEAATGLMVKGLGLPMKYALIAMNEIIVNWAILTEFYE